MLNKKQFAVLNYAQEGHVYKTNHSYHLPNHLSVTEITCDLIELGFLEEYRVPGTIGCTKARLTSAGRAVLEGRVKA